MTLIVQKYGGTSVADTNSLKLVAERIIECKEDNNDVVVVPSAMGSSTDELIHLASQLSEKPTPREMDMLLSAGERITMSLLSMHLNSLGYSSFSLTGSQAGIITTSRHGKAEIEEITGERVKEGIDQGDIVIVAGFQGFNRDTREITTLGRGGSDATAVALAAALGAERCEIFTDVEGVYTADPRIITNAQLIDEITYDEIHECETEFFNMVKDKGLFDIEPLELIGPIAPRSVFSFRVKGTSPSDIAGFLDMQNVCVRTGHMCCLLYTSDAADE